MNKQVNYWLDKLKNAETLNLPVFPLSNSIEEAVSSVEIPVSADEVKSIREIGGNKDLNILKLFLGGLSIVLWKYSLQEEIIISTPPLKLPDEDINGKGTLYCKLNMQKDLLVHALLNQVHETLNDAYLNSEYDEEQFLLNYSLQNGGNLLPIKGIGFNYQKINASGNWLSNHHLLFEFIEDTSSIIRVTSSITLFPQQLLHNMAKSLLISVLDLSKNKNEKIAVCSILPSNSLQLWQEQFIKNNRDYPTNITVVDLFAQNVTKNPEKTALVYGEKLTTYAELNEWSAQIARYIIHHTNKKPGLLIGIMLKHSAALVATVLGILRAGAAYVPIDPDYPIERIRDIINDTECPIVFTENDQEQITIDGCKFVNIATHVHVENNLSLSTPKPDDIAYVIYSSGTTGAPKGIMIQHAAILNLLFWYNEHYSINEQTRIIQLTNIVVDIAFQEIFSALINGLTLFIPQKEERQDKTLFIHFLEKHQINFIQVIPDTLAEYFLNTPTLKFLNQILCGGDKLSEKLKDDIVLKGYKLYNIYGQTETAIDTVEGICIYGVPIKFNEYVANYEVLILDEQKNLCPEYVTGEIYTAGKGLALGYFKQPELTAKKFVDHPFKKGQRIYRTGDMGRRLPDGSIQLIGRKDDQVKIRGYRIELGEIENALIQIEGIKQTCVLAKERKTETGNIKYLVAYCVGDNNEKTLDQPTILDKLSKMLPEYMVPSALVIMESFPLTKNGKINKRAFPDPEFSSLEEYTAPTTEVEAEICNIWQKVLGLERVGINDNFFKIGGNSILTIQVSHRMNKALGYNVKVADVFKYKTIAQILHHSLGQNQTHIPKTNAKQSILSFAQERLWFIEQYEQGTNAYHIPEVFELATDTDVKGVKYALQQIVSRHEVLRTTIEQVDNQDHSIQQVHETPLPIEETIITEEENVEALIKKDINRPFDLSSEYPIRVKFYTIKSVSKNSLHKTILLITTHHIASDGWSEDIFLKELFAYYEAYINKDTTFSLPALEIQYKDYALWQRSYLTGEILKKQLSYWKEKLLGYQTLEFPTDYVRPSNIDYKGAQQAFILSKETSKKLRALAQRYGATLHSVMLSSINILLNKYTGQEDIVIGSAIANRHHRQTEGLIGFFVNTQAHRTQLSKAQSFEALIQQVHQEQIEAQNHQDLPFEKLVDELDVERDPSRHPVFQVMFTMQSLGHQNKTTDQQKSYFKPYQVNNIYEVEKFDLSFYIEDSQEELIGQIGYATSLFHKDKITRLIHHYTYLLDELTISPNKSYNELSLLNTDEHKKIIYDWNVTDKDYPKDKTIYMLFEEQAAKTPNNIALVYEQQQLTYAELNEKSNQLARHIRAQYEQRTKQALTPDTIIALCLDRSLEMVIGIMAILKAGGAYVPIDPNYPQDRIDYILEDTQAKLILSQKYLTQTSQIHLPQEKIIYIDLSEKLYNIEDTSNLPQHSKPNDIAYVIYTSGTTGKPKASLIEHHSFVNLNIWYSEEFNLTASDSFIICSEICFDLTQKNYFSPLINGGIIYIPRSGLYDPFNIANIILSNNINRINCAPSAFTPILDEIYKQQDCYAFDYIFLGGEPIPDTILQTIKSKMPHGYFVNTYGPSECCDVTTFFKSSYKDLPDSAIPLGIPVNNFKHYVLNSNKQPVPIGVTGELYIGGAGLARGYLNSPELTAERFISNPFATESDKAKGYTRLYKTGDLVKWLPDGNLEYIGRNDDQVKIRGYRIELGEIEHALTQIQGIKQACVLANEKKTTLGTNKYLVGYYVWDHHHESLPPTTILDKLSQALPTYMIPDALIAMESFPLTINGKLDKRALPQPDLSSAATYIAPTLETEALICKIWQEVLGLARVGITDNFFRIGGNSILAIQVSHRMTKALGHDVKVADIFKYKTIAQLHAHSLGKAQILIPKVHANQAMLSFAQERLWFIEQYEQGTNAYHIPEVFELATDTRIEAIRYALQQIVSRHEILRTTIEQGIQKVHTEPLSIEEIRLTDQQDYHALIKEHANHPFDLSRDYPIRVKFYIIESSTDPSLRKTLLLINTHHIASDGWSGDIFQRELFLYYEAYINKDTTFSLPALEIQYKDYAVWQKTYLTGDTLAKQLSYWKNTLTGYQPLAFPTDYARPNEIDYRGAHHRFTLNKEITQQLRSLAQAYGVTLHSVLLSSITILLSKYTGQDDIVMGSPIANRHHMQTEGLIGFFVNMLVNRTVLHNTQSFEALIQQVQQQQIEAQNHQDLPFEKLVDELAVERDPSRHPIFQIMFGVQSFGGEDKVSDQQKNYLKPYQVEDSYEIEKFDLSITIEDTQQETLVGQISYATSLFHKDTITRLVDHYTHLLTQLTEAPQKAYSACSLLNTAAYKKIIYDWNATDKDYPSNKTIHQLFQEQVAKTPNNIALVYQDQQLTYKQLNEKSNQLAHHLSAEYEQRTKQVLSPDTLIALCLDRGLEMVIGILAVLKAGGAYVPIDPSYPQQRINYILEDTQAAFILSQKSLTVSNQIQLPQDKIIYIDLSEKLYNKEETSNLPQHSKSNNIAYVIYTSGTTGKPKGVMVEHKGIINLIQNQIDYFDMKPEDNAMQFAAYVFDASVSELFTAITIGAKLSIVPNTLKQDVQLLGDYIAHHQIHVATLPPSLLSAMAYKDYAFLKTLIVAGEACPTQTMRTWSRGRRFINAYGPTEGTVCAMMHRYEQGDVNTNVGKPIDNIKVYVLDPNNNPVPIGVVAELYIGGAGLARGYVNNKALTAERFIANPFATEADKTKGYTRLYKTGDVVRWLPDGNIEYIGRNDDQVKIRGYRIELGEIENALSQIVGIKQACVVTKERKTETSNHKYLVGYYVLDDKDATLTTATILEKLSQVLPEYMVPSALVAMGSFPLTINGKLDKQALPDPEFSSEANYVKPETELEVKLCEIWQEILGLNKISIKDNFFRIGGDSILSIQISSRIRQAGFSCQVKDIFEYKTIAKLAEYLSKKTSEVSIKTEQGVLIGALDLLPIQQWFVEKVEYRAFVKPNHWNQSFLIKVPELDTEKLKAIIQTLVSYHDVLRIQYIKEQEANTTKIHWKQVYQSHIALPKFKTLDISKHTATEVQQILTNWQSDFDLERGILFQAGYLYGYKDGSARIYFALHHMIVDAVSWRILTEDVKTLYEGKTLPPKGSSYRQWVNSVKNYPEQHPLEAAYWKDQLNGIYKYSLENYQTKRSEVFFELDRILTKSLLQEASKAYHTEINDLLLTALAYALKEINNSNTQCITLEGHGREDIDHFIDHSRTVGWFTTMFPIKLELQNNLKESIQFIKESLRNVPNKGIGFGAFATAKETSYTHADLAPISFNYLGQFDIQERDWQIVSEDSGNSMDLANKDHNIININGMVSNGKLGFSVVTRLGEDATKKLSDSFEDQLTKIINHCNEKLENKEVSYTPSDFKSVRISQSLLDKLQLKAKKPI